MIGYEEGYDVLWRSDDEVKRVVMKKKMKELDSLLRISPYVLRPSDM